MERDTLDRFEQLFREALARAPDERAAFLDTHCRDDPELRQELESLLRADAKAEAAGFLDPPIWRIPSHEDRTATFAPPPRRAPPRPGDLPSVAVLERPHPGGARLSVDQYDILEELGRGGMGVVYKARDVRLRRTVALKFLPPSRHTQARARRRFVQEARLASALDHPNICTIHEIGETETGPLYIAMAYYEGETLKEKIADGPLPLDEALDYARQIADGLQRAHGTGIVHRDVKPANVIVTDDGLVKLLDFGVAKMADRSRTRTGAVLGTLGYVSPEQVQGAPVDERADLWALALQDAVEEGIKLLRRGMAGCRAAGADMDRPYFAALLAEAYGRNERVDDGLAVLDEALKHVRGDRSYFYEAELHRLKGTLLRQRRTQGDRVAAEAALLRAHTRAREMGTPPLELRAATSLARLWRRTTRSADGLDLVEAAYRRFTDGFDTPDLVEAQALLSANER